jgi:hypothetical protein
VWNSVLPTVLINSPRKIGFFVVCPGFFKFNCTCFLCTVAAVEISDRKDLNTLYKFRNLISVNRIFIKDYKVSVSIWHIRSESRVTFEMPQLSDLQKCVWLRDGVSIRAIAREINVDNVWVTFWETSLSIPFTKLKVWRCQNVWVFNGRNCTVALKKTGHVKKKTIFSGF